MSDSSQPESTQDLQSRSDFVRQLRDKAERAAEASVHYASMSQQYLELSQRFSQLAQQADSSSIADLQQTLKAIEKQTPQQLPASALQSSALISSELPAPMLQSPGGEVIEPPATVVAQADDVAAGGTPAENSHDSISPSPKRRPAKSRKVNTRRLVERVRAAKLAAKRVRVKAKKSDLQPKVRTATEELKKGGSSIATSVCLLAVSVFLLSLMRFQFEVDVPLNPIMAGFAEEVKPVEEPMPVEPPEEEQGDQVEMETEEAVEEPVEPEPEPKPDEVPPEVTEPAEVPAETEMADVALPEVETGLEAATAEATDAAAVDANPRSDAGRKAMLQKYGGSVASESAVQHGLEWLASIQHPQQGYWDFPFVGESGNAGTINNPIGGTAYALLPFLAAGQTHQEGKYQKQIQAGLNFLAKIGINAPAGYDLRGMINKQSEDDAPNEAYYVHGAATLVLCEAYGMTKDRRLKRAAEGAVKFIVNSQDPKGGGWRYNPQEPGSTSVTAIQVMALMAAKKAELKVPDKTLQGATHYLDSVQVDKEGRYGYEVEKKQYKGSITAMSLLCRMYLGWGRDDGDMRAGVALLDKAGPYDNLYTLYFATQVMKNWGGEEWDRWNTRLRDDLVSWQETEGPAKGSWKPRTGAIHAKQGGRLLTTALATLTLEVYYRYKPLLPEAAAVTTVAE